MDNEDYNIELKKIKLWSGYGKGFIRTACWCCPFQKSDQWEALRKNYKGLWEVMKLLSKRWEFVLHEGDSNYTRFKNYWDKQI